MKNKFLKHLFEALCKPQDFHDTVMCIVMWIPLINLIPVFLLPQPYKVVFCTILLAIQLICLGVAKAYRKGYIEACKEFHTKFTVHIADEISSLMEIRLSDTEITKESLH